MLIYALSDRLIYLSCVSAATPVSGKSCGLLAMVWYAFSYGLICFYNSRRAAYTFHSQQELSLHVTPDSQ